MSSNPQWKSFQTPPALNDTSIIDFKPMSLNSNGSPSGGACAGGNMRCSATNGLGYSTNNHNHNHNHNHYHSQDTIKDMASNLFTSHNNYSNYMYSNSSPTIARFPIGTFTGNEGNEMYNGDSMQQPQQQQQQQSPSSNMMNISNSSYNNDSNLSNQGTRETGIIEKLLHSYGFIQCCERQARLFFHFSQFSGNIEHLKIGDPVEFEMTYDRRTGKPIASLVSKIAPEVVLSEERVTGTVTTELKSEGASGGETQGRISYENRGECFFLPYTKDDVEGNVTLRVGDKVSFQIATNPRGNLGATHVRLENPAHPVKYQGVVCSIKDSFGFIERADIVKEIFFHCSEVQAKDGLQPGDDVEFIIQTKKGKEVACDITQLPPGTVVFEDICEKIVKGQVQKPVERNRGQTPAAVVDPLPGKIRYRAPDHSEVEVPFGEKDQLGAYTLRHGDWVQFNIATDRRDLLQRATKISLLPESFTVSGERREVGAIAAVKDFYGFIRCADRDARLYFHFSELINTDNPSLNDEVEFTVIQDPCSSFGNQRQSAIRIKTLPPGSVQFETIVERGVAGVVTKDAPFSWHPKSPTKNQMSNGEKSSETGLIAYTCNGIKKTIPFSPKDCDHKSPPKVGDKVEFNICQVKRNKEQMAVDVVVDKSSSSQNPVEVSNGVVSLSPTLAPAQQAKNGYISGLPLRGYIAALKEGFGFIEAADLDKEIFFHFSNFDGDASKLEIGSEVEYTVVNSTRGGGNVPCICGEQVILLSKGSVHPNVTISDELKVGTIIRPLRSVNRDQPQYAGLIKSNPLTDGEDAVEFEFGISGLANKRELLQPGDTVEYQVSSNNRAVNISAIRKKNRSTVESIKGNFGFLAFEPEEGKKLFFHITEVKDGATLQPGDMVEFVVVTNQRTGKSFACSISKITEKLERPERLISRLRTTSVDEGPRLVIVRQPRGPDEEGNAGNKGFSLDARRQRSPGQLLD